MAVVGGLVVGTVVGVVVAGVADVVLVLVARDWPPRAASAAARATARAAATAITRMLAARRRTGLIGLSRERGTQLGGGFADGGLGDRCDPGHLEEPVDHPVIAT